ncbi:SF3a splicing factor complex subunit [Blastocladiella emersonii ATCC 22665]|nr:SF3a splicing factor complex subunit [Blastocladiella emersonii ATCC 22665]
MNRLTQCNELSDARLSVSGTRVPIREVSERSRALIGDGDAVGDEEELTEWHGERVDRYDVRHLLNGPHEVGGRGAGVEEEDADVSDEELDDERYRDLAADDGDGEPDVSPTSRARADSENGDGDDAEVLRPPSKRQRRDREPNAPHNEIHFDYSLLDPDVKPSDPQLVAILHKTAAVIARQPDPRLAETTIAGKQATDPRFAFLRAAGPGHGYFRKVVAAMLDGTWVEPAPEPAPEAEPEPVPQPQPRAQGPTIDMSAIKATARAVARAGPGLEARLRERQGRDPRFAFLNPWHPMYTSFRALVQSNAVAPAPAVADASLEQEDQAPAVVVDQPPRPTRPPAAKPGLVAYASSDDDDDDDE